MSASVNVSGVITGAARIALEVPSSDAEVERRSLDTMAAAGPVDGKRRRRLMRDCR